MPSLTNDGDVSILYLDEPDASDSENRFNPEWLASVNALLDEVEASQGPRALVTTARGKFYSTGADLAWGAANPGRIDWLLTEIQAVLARILVLPVPTVAAMQGHTFGAGAFLAMAHDRTVMRADRGYFCLPGITLGGSYAPGVLALAAARLPARAGHEALMTGRRYGGIDAERAGLVDAVESDSRVLESAVEYAHGVAQTRGPVLGEIKVGLYEPVVAALRTPVTGYNR
ncbi:enoyl-CoA hydratase/isomerase family protein [Antrihabitans stalactiti]|uniref:Enoyl-CoA hydratase/isomerase family protein n=1 Tax=Antrihabitans stalactiti TaxID=2584121 RepID=A0A848K7D5_9NOCA|nr:enoyl-CoA hydratase/isomerase family protein [Antrihabitans stalactiti]NMN94693.1 enoyl-CoA hydratase/isomerase family protein [Antrihabitans stalactiti]